MSDHSDKFAAVEIRPRTTEDGGAGLNAFIGGKMLGQVLTDDSGHVLVRLSRHALTNGMKPNSREIYGGLLPSESPFP